MFSYLKFWWKSSNQHGLHSPFVYNYLTKGLYEAEVMSNNESLNWILKSIKYFKPNKIHVVGDELNCNLIEFKELFTKDVIEANIIIVDKEASNKQECFTLIENISSEQILLFKDSIYNEKFQKKLRDHREITIVVDFFVGSLISKRKEQLKQNFFLRL